MNQTQMSKAEKLASRNYNTIMVQDRLSDSSVVFVASNPELKGCKAQGASPMEAIANLRDARIDYIYFLLEDGIEVPVPRSQSIMTGAEFGTPQTVEVYFESQKSLSNEEEREIENPPGSGEDSLETWSINDVAESA